MKAFDTYISMASWEDRFLLGTARVMSECKISNHLLFRFEQAPGVFDTYPYCSKSFQLASARGVRVADCALAFHSAADNWSYVGKFLSEHVRPGSSVLIDISTMTREIIWLCFWFCEQLDCTITYVYHRAGSYGNWVSRDPQRPRLVHRMSGLASLARRTAVLMVVGYDVDRVQQILNYFEPAIALLLRA